MKTPEHRMVGKDKFTSYEGAPETQQDLEAIVDKSRGRVLATAGKRFRSKMETRQTREARRIANSKPLSAKQRTYSSQDLQV